MSDIFDRSELNRRMDGAISAFKHELASLRTGRASANLLDSIMVEAYGAHVAINQVANITVPEPRMLGVSVWDKSMVSAVERAIRESKLGLNPIVDGTMLRIPLPELNEERRKELARVANQFAEQARIAIRHIRRDGIDSVRKAEKHGEIAKDDAYQMCEDIQKITDDMISKVDKVLSEKEAEIMQI